MAKRKLPPKTWVYSPHSLPKPKVPEASKAQITERAQVLIEEWKPIHIKKPPKGYRFNYIVDLYTKWHRNFFYFVAKYASPGPTALSPFFEAPFTRMEYRGENRFDVAYMRHTGKWWVVDENLTLTKALETIRGNGIYHP
jgi:hypothetical protein